MKIIKKLFLTLLTLLTFTLQSCGSDENEIEGVSSPTNLAISAVKVGEDGNNPNGDGTGVVNFTISATNATSYKVLINNETLDLTENTFSYTFTQGGTNDYELIVAAYNSAGNTSINYALTVFVKTELKLIWQDEFDANGAPNSSNWGYNIGVGNNGWGNNESQYYTDRLDNAKVENGVLKITAKKESFGGSEYTSARLISAGKFEFTYGRVDVRAKLPAGGGVWPAIWMLGANFGSVGWPACGEIDIMEYVGNNPGQISSALHTTSSFGNTVNYKATSISNETTEFHIYSVIWTENSITFLLDDVEFYTYNPAIKNDATWPFYNNQFLILNIAMGGNLGGTIDPNFSTSTMEIDYVRVYQ